MENNELSLKNSETAVFDSKTISEFKVFHIPIILFEEISKSLGISDPRKIRARGGEYSLIEINPNHHNTGFKGAIGLKISDNFTNFILWERIPKGKPDDVFEPTPILEITARIASTGTWAYGRGNLMKEEITAELGSLTYGFSLQRPTSKLVAMIIHRAHLLTQNPSFKNQRFWQAQAWPGEYTSPD